MNVGMTKCRGVGVTFCLVKVNIFCLVKLVGMTMNVVEHAQFQGLRF